KKTYFAAEDPTNLRRLLAKKEDQLKEQKQSFEEILPELKTLKGLPVESPSVKYYDSVEGIRAIVSSFYETHKQPNQQAYGVTNVDQLHAFFPEIDANQANPARLHAHVTSQVIYTTKQGAVYRSTDKQRNRISRFVPSKFQLNGDLSIVGDHIVMLALTGSKPIGVTIESKELAAMMRGLFDLAWESAEKYDKSA
ncbi:MAG TPA: hypothetical protein VLF87_03500, partial [Patescibacteria group bacterium]|nr:hypothetical protein [Patescibacteria group bacterium]